MADILISKSLRYIGHVYRIGRERLPRQTTPQFTAEDVTAKSGLTTVKRNIRWRDLTGTGSGSSNIENN